MLAGFDAKPLKRASRRQVERAQGRIGFVEMWPLATAPAGYLVCNGAAVSRQAYGALFAIIGTTFGTGDGSTTFNLPNYVDRMPVGSGNLYTVGATGGSKDAINVAHAHTAASVVTDSGHAHAQNGNTLYFVGASTVNTAGPSFSASTQALNTGSSTTGVSVATTVDSAGASGTNANLPPYLGVNFIIKY